jgi:hypothetical protein
MVRGSGAAVNLSSDALPVLHCANSPWGLWLFSEYRCTTTASDHHGTVRLDEHGNQSSSCSCCD